MTIYTLPVSGDELCIVVDGGSGRLTKALRREVCPDCSGIDCYRDCLTGELVDDRESEEDALARRAYNAALDAVESLALAHVCAGIDIGAAAYVAGVATALEAITNHLE